MPMNNMDRYWNNKKCLTYSGTNETKWNKRNVSHFTDAGCMAADVMIVDNPWTMMMMMMMNMSYRPKDQATDRLSKPVQWSLETISMPSIAELLSIAHSEWHTFSPATIYVRLADDPSIWWSVWRCFSFCHTFALFISFIHSVSQSFIHQFVDISFVCGVSIIRPDLFPIHIPYFHTFSLSINTSIRPYIISLM